MIEFELVIPSIIAGTLMFFAPCTLPVLPGFIAYISGNAAKDNEVIGKKHRLRHTIVQSVSFLLGFLSVFNVLGTIIRLGIVSFNGETLRIMTGLVIVVFGVYLLLQYFKKIPVFLLQSKEFSVGKYVKPTSSFGSFIIGSTFAIGWSPCVGPILASILLLSSQSKTIVSGIFHLLFFSLGFAIPFLLLSISIGLGLNLLTQKVKAVLKYITFISGIFLIVIGLLMITDTYNLVMGSFYRVIVYPPTAWMYAFL